MRISAAEIKAVAGAIKRAMSAGYPSRGHISPIDFTWEKVARRAIRASRRARAREPHAPGSCLMCKAPAVR